jgi:hypothetical protein
MHAVRPCGGELHHLRVQRADDDWRVLLRPRCAVRCRVHRVEVRAHVLERLAGIMAPHGLHQRLMRDADAEDEAAPGLLGEPMSGRGHRHRIAAVHVGDPGGDDQRGGGVQQIRRRGQRLTADPSGNQSAA